MKLYITSTESAEFSTPQEVVSYSIIEKKLFFSTHYFLHVELKESVPLFGLEKFGIEQKFGANFFIAPRYKKDDIRNFNKFPISVNVFISRKNNYYSIEKKELIFYAIAELNVSR